jgi:hypothetical protein
VLAATRQSAFLPTTTSSANCTADAGADVKSSPMSTKTKTKTTADPQEVVELKNLLPCVPALSRARRSQSALDPSQMGKTD